MKKYTLTIALCIFVVAISCCKRGSTQPRDGNAVQRNAVQTFVRGIGSEGCPYLIEIREDIDEYHLLKTKHIVRMAIKDESIWHCSGKGELTCQKIFVDMASISEIRDQLRSVLSKCTINPDGEQDNE